MSSQQQAEPARRATEAEPIDEGGARGAEKPALSVFPYDRTGRRGGTPPLSRRGPTACPDCGGATIDAQGALDCRDCEWAGVR